MFDKHKWKMFGQNWEIKYVCCFKSQNFYFPKSVHQSSGKFEIEQDKDIFLFCFLTPTSQKFWEDHHKDQTSWIISRLYFNARASSSLPKRCQELLWFSFHILNNFQMLLKLQRDARYSSFLKFKLHIIVPKICSCTKF